MLQLIHQYTPVPAAGDRDQSSQKTVDDEESVELSARFWQLLTVICVTVTQYPVISPKTGCGKQDKSYMLLSGGVNMPMLPPLAL